MRRERRAPACKAAASVNRYGRGLQRGVAQVFQPAVSPTFQSASLQNPNAASDIQTAGGLENPRNGRLESLRYGGERSR